MADLDKTFRRIDAFKLSDIARLSGLSRAAILNIRNGDTPNPGILTMEKLESALDQLEAKQKIQVGAE